MAVNKVVVNTQTILDLSNDTISSENDLSNGITALSKDGTLITGKASPSEKSYQYLQFNSSNTSRISAGNLYAVKRGNIVCVFTDVDFEVGSTITMTASDVTTERYNLNESSYEKMKIGNIPTSWTGTTFPLSARDIAGIHLPSSGYPYIYFSNWSTIANNYSNFFWLITITGAGEDLNYTISNQTPTLNDTLTSSTKISIATLGGMCFIRGTLYFSNSSTGWENEFTLPNDFHPPVNIPTTLTRFGTNDPYACALQIDTDGVAKVYKTTYSKSLLIIKDYGIQTNTPYYFETVYPLSLGTEYTGNYS